MVREIARLWSFIELKFVARLLSAGLATTTIVAAAIAVGACGNDPSGCGTSSTSTTPT